MRVLLLIPMISYSMRAPYTGFNLWVGCLLHKEYFMQGIRYIMFLSMVLASHVESVYGDTISKDCLFGEVITSYKCV